MSRSNDAETNLEIIEKERAAAGVRAAGEMQLIFSRGQLDVAAGKVVAAVVQVAADRGDHVGSVADFLEREVEAITVDQVVEVQIGRVVHGEVRVEIHRGAGKIVRAVRKNVAAELQTEGTDIGIERRGRGITKR